MSQFDERIERYLDEVLAAAPPLGPEQIALIIRTFGPDRAAPALPDAV